jgi:hypothetical protein
MDEGAEASSRKVGGRDAGGGGSKASKITGIPKCNFGTRERKKEKMGRAACAKAMA